MTLKRNIVNLFLSQSASYLIPLLQFPYLTRVLGIEYFGLFVFSLSIINFLMIVTNYGFELYLPKELAEQQGNQSMVNAYFSQTLVVRTGLVFVCVLILAGIYIFTNYYKDHFELIGLILVSVVCNAYSFLWLYQSKEVIYLYSRIVVTIRLVGVGLVFILIHGKADFNRLFLIIALTNACTLLVCYVQVKKRFMIKFKLPSMRQVRELFKQSSGFFVSRLGVSVYATLGSFVVGTLSHSLTEVAYYGAAQQLYTAGLYAMSAISTPLLPYMVRTRNYSVFFKITAVSLAVTILGACIGWLFGGQILSLVYGTNLRAAEPVLNIFMITIILSVMGVHLGYPALIPLGRAKAANLSVIYAGMAQLGMIGIIMLLKVPVTAVVIAVTYLICDLVMMLYRGNVFIFSYKKLVFEERNRC
jgi:O-antigen/teichoic acid export membrane protein